MTETLEVFPEIHDLLHRFHLHRKLILSLKLKEYCAGEILYELCQTQISRTKFVIVKSLILDCSILPLSIVFQFYHQGCERRAEILGRRVIIESYYNIGCLMIVLSFSGAARLISLKYIS